MIRETGVSRIGLDIHRKFSRVTERDGESKVVRRRRRAELAGGYAGGVRGHLRLGWMSDELAAVD